MCEPKQRERIGAIAFRLGNVGKCQEKSNESSKQYVSESGTYLRIDQETPAYVRSRCVLHSMESIEGWYRRH